MALESKRTIPQLVTECKRLKVEVVPEGKKLMKTDYIRALRNYHLDRTYGVDRINQPQSLSKILRIDSPMLCFRFKELKPQEQQEIWQSDNWMFEKKEDGCRMLIFIKDGQFDFYSRHSSVTDFLPISYKDNLYIPNINTRMLEGVDYVIDAEIICNNPMLITHLQERGIETVTMLQAVTAVLNMLPALAISIQKAVGGFQFQALDIIYNNGWIMDMPLIERRRVMVEKVIQLQQAGMMVSIPPATRKYKKQFYETILGAGQEGVVAKRLDSIYVPDTTRKRDAWVKLKRTLSGAIGDTIAAFISGYEPGTSGKRHENKVGTLIFSVFVIDSIGNQEQREIAYISGFPDELRNTITDYDADGEPILKAEWYGRVAEIDGMDISSKSLRFSHAVIKYFREDKRKEECFLSKEFLESEVH